MRARNTTNTERVVVTLRDHDILAAIKEESDVFAQARILAEYRDRCCIDYAAAARDAARMSLLEAKVIGNRLDEARLHSRKREAALLLETAEDFDNCKY